MRVVALKRIKYPRPDGKEHAPGDTFDIENPRHLKALTLTRIVRAQEPQDPPKTQRAPRRGRQPDDQPAETKQMEANTGSAAQPAQESDASRYLRRDMRAED